MNRRRVDAHLVSTCIEHGTDILKGTDSAADGEGDENLAGNLLYGVNRRITLFMACRNIEEGDFVSSLFVVATRDLHGISRIANPHEVNAFHYPASVDIQTGNNPFRQCHQSVARKLSTIACAVAKSRVPS